MSSDETSVRHQIEVILQEISDMDAQKQTAHKLTTKQEDFLEVENTCCLCGTELIFKHQQVDGAVKIKEKAQCPCCNIQLKDKEHLIH